MNLTINQPSTSTANVTTCNSYLWNGNTYTASGVYTFTTTNWLNCDSIATLNLTINTPSTSSQNVTTCSSYLWNGKTYSVSGTYIFNTTNKNGCDSAATLNLTINNITPVSKLLKVEGCTLVVYNGHGYNYSGVLNDTIKSVGGCDSVYLLVSIVVHNDFAVRQSNSIVSCKPIVYNGTLYSGSAIVVDTIKNVFGCDSIYKMNYITIKTILPTNKSTVLAGCDSVLYKNKLYYKDTLMADTIMSIGGCDSVYNLLQIKIYPKPTNTVSVPTRGCQNSGILFSYTGDVSNVASYNWIFGDGNVSYGSDPTYVYTDTGIFKVHFYATGLGGCNSDTFSQLIHIFSSPQINAGNDTSVFAGTSIPINIQSTNNIATVNWMPGLYLSNDTALNTVCSPLNDISYIIQATAINGCKGYDTLNVKVLDKPIIPNSFSPNGDGIHDRWVFANSTLYKTLSVKVFDRNGTNVYENKQYDNSWDGTLNGNPLPIGTYYYVIMVNNIYQISGWVYILR